MRARVGYLCFIIILIYAFFRFLIIRSSLSG